MRVPSLLLNGVCDRDQTTGSRLDPRAEAEPRRTRLGSRPRPAAGVRSGLLPAILAALALAFVPLRSPAATVPPAPASAWLLDDGAGTTAEDSWGSRDGALMGGMGTANWLTSTPRDYPGNRCLFFDGVNDRVVLSTGHILSNFTHFTISAWFQWTDTAPRKEYAIYSERDECQYNVLILEVEDRLGLPGGVAFGLFDRNPYPNPCGSGGWNFARDGSGLPSSEEWHHVVAVFRDDGEVRIFVDRMLAEVKTGVASYMGAEGFTTIGHTHTVGYDSYFAGKLDEIGVWTTALTDSEAVWVYDHSLRDLMLVGVESDLRPQLSTPRLSAAPLPFRGGSLRIVYERPASQAGGPVDVVLADIHGRVVREIATAVSVDAQSAFTWDGTDGRGQTVRPGVYFLSASEPGGRSRVKVAVLK